MPTPPPPPKWVLDINDPNPPKPKNTSLPDPPGYSSQSTSKSGGKGKALASTKASKAPSTEEMDTLKMKKAWEIAIGPAKQLPMNAIGMYMTGNSLQIFSIMMVFMLFKTPITSIFSMNPLFARFETEGTKSRLLGVKLVYIACNCLALALGIWKVNGMGLLPYVHLLNISNSMLTSCRTTSSDWLAWETVREPLYRARLVQSL